MKKLVCIVLILIGGSAVFTAHSVFDGKIENIEEIDRRLDDELNAKKDDAYKKDKAREAAQELEEEIRKLDAAEKAREEELKGKDKGEIAQDPEIQNIERQRQLADAIFKKAQSSEFIFDASIDQLTKEFAQQQIKDAQKTIDAIKKQVKEIESHFVPVEGEGKGTGAGTTGGDTNPTQGTGQQAQGTVPSQEAYKFTTVDAYKTDLGSKFASAKTVDDKLQIVKDQKQTILIDLYDNLDLQKDALQVLYDQIKREKLPNTVELDWVADRIKTIKQDIPQLFQAAARVSAGELSVNDFGDLLISEKAVDAMQNHGADPNAVALVNDAVHSGQVSELESPSWTEIKDLSDEEKQSIIDLSNLLADPTLFAQREKLLMEMSQNILKKGDVPIGSLSAVISATPRALIDFLSPYQSTLGRATKTLGEWITLFADVTQKAPTWLENSANLVVWAQDLSTSPIRGGLLTTALGIATSDENIKLLRDNLAMARRNIPGFDTLVTQAARWTRTLKVKDIGELAQKLGQSMQDTAQSWKSQELRIQDAEVLARQYQDALIALQKDRYTLNLMTDKEYKQADFVNKADAWFNDVFRSIDGTSKSSAQRKYKEARDDLIKILDLPPAPTSTEIAKALKTALSDESKKADVQAKVDTLVKNTDKLAQVYKEYVDQLDAAKVIFDFDLNKVGDIIKYNPDANVPDLIKEILNLRGQKMAAVNAMRDQLNALKETIKQSNATETSGQIQALNNDFIAKLSDMITRKTITTMGSYEQALQDLVPKIITHQGIINGIVQKAKNEASIDSFVDVGDGSDTDIDVEAASWGGVHL